MNTPKLLLISLMLSASPVALSGSAVEPAEAGLSSSSEPSVKVTNEQFTDGGMFDLYEDNRRSGIPNLITEDFLLLAYSQMRQQSIVSLEEQLVQPALSNLLDSVQSDLEKDIAAQQASAVLDDNLGYIKLVKSLLNDQPMDDLPADAAREYELVKLAQGPANSPIWGSVVDYSQFIARGRYADTDEAAAYFRAVRYATTALFAFQPSKATGVDVTQAEHNAARAADIAARLNKTGIDSLYAQIQEALFWHFGHPDDMQHADILEVSAQADHDSLASALVAYAIEQQRVPRIIGGIVDKSKLEEGLTAGQAMIGWRLLPSSYSASAAVFQQLVYQQGDTLELDCEGCENPPDNASLIQGKLVKGYPSYLEYLALLGSSEAGTLLTEKQYLRYRAYDTQRDLALDYVADGEGLEKYHQHVIQALIRDTGAGPQTLATASGFWVWQKYLGLLYQKQPYTVIGKNISLASSKTRPGAWLVPATSSYRALNALIAKHAEIDPDLRWQKLAGIVGKCIDISSRIELGLALSEKQEHYLNQIDKKMIAIGLGADLPIVADLHTNAAENRVLELGIEHPVIVQRSAARGAGFRVREFKMPMAQRLDNQTWRELLAAETTAK